jgi:ATP-binding cassette subfamily F protein uup
LVIEAKDLSFSYGDRVIVDGLSLNLKRGNRLGLVGANGTGKTTLLKLLTGVLAPNSGTVKLGTQLEIAHLDQGRQSLHPSTTLRDALTGGHGDLVMVGDSSRHVMSYMKDFLFTPEQARSPLSVLSGGERARVMLARSLARKSNLLVLDEPTNDLDLETLDVLQETLSDYSGTVILVSHDRDFLDRIVTSVLSPDDNGHWTEYAGGYSDMIAQRGAEPASTLTRARKPTRMPAQSTKPAQGSSDQLKPAKAGKMSFKDKHALETLPKEIARLEAKVRTLQGLLEDPNLYARDHARFVAATNDLAATQNAILAAEEKWLELELMRTEIEGA